MDSNTQPVTAPGPASSGVDPGRTPRLLSHDQMREHRDNQLVTVLSDRDRHAMFVRYDNVWWIGDHDGFIEITSPDHNAKLDRWHERLTNGALWT